MADSPPPKREDNFLLLLVSGAFVGGLIGGGCGGPLFGGLIAATVGALTFTWFGERGKHRVEATKVIYFTWLVFTVPAGAFGFYVGRALWA